MAVNQAIYGVGVYGIASYGVVPVTVPVSGVAITATNIGSVSVYGDSNLTLSSVNAVATADTDIIITADAEHTLVSVSAAFAQGSVGIVGVAIHQVDGVVATGNNNTVIMTGDANLSTTGVLANIHQGVSTVLASAVADTVGVVATGVVDVSGDGWKVYSRIIVSVSTGVQGTTFITDVLVTAASDVPVYGVSGIGQSNTAVVKAKAIVLPEAEGSTGVIGDAVVTADSVYAVSSVEAAGDVFDVEVVATALLLPEGVTASATADTDIIITADANHTLVSVVAEFAEGQVGVVGVAVTETPSVEGVVETTDSVVAASAVSSVDTETLVGEYNDVVVTASAVSLIRDTQYAIASMTGYTNDDLEITADSVFAVSNFTAYAYTNNVVVVAESNIEVYGVLTYVFTTFGTQVIEGQGNLFYVDGVSAEAQVGDQSIVVADSNYLLSGVSANVTADTDIIIEADSTHTLISVVGVALNGGVGEVTAAGVTNLTGISVEATGVVSAVSMYGTAKIIPFPVTASAFVKDVEVIADSNTVLDSGPVYARIGNAIVIADSNVTVAVEQMESFLGEDYTVTATALTSVDGFALTISTTEPDVTAEVTVFYPDAFALDRIAYVPSREGSNNRTAVVPASEPRVALVPVDSQSRTIAIAA